MYLVMEPGGEFEEREGCPSLEEMQEIVDGYVDCLDTSGKQRRVAVWFNDEGKLRGMKPSLAVPAIDDMVVGPVVVTAVDMTDGETMPLTEDEVREFRAGFKQHAVVFGHGLIPVLEIER